MAVTLAAIGLLGLPAPPASADGDPASDVLPGQSVFLPYSPMTAATGRRLYALTAAAARAGYPVRVALISTPGDLGVVPGLFGRPAAYARFLSAELGGVVPGPVLVVMPGGAGLARSGRALPLGAAAAVIPGAGADALASAAIRMIPVLAQTAGHPLPSNATAQAPAGAPPATVRHALRAVAVLCALAALGIAAAFVLRRRAQDAGSALARHEVEPHGDDRH